MKKILLTSIVLFGVSFNLSANSAIYLKKSCDSGNAKKCFKLGHIYRDGVGVNINYINAIKYYLMACENGYPEACNNLGVRYINGQGAKENKAEAVKFFAKACENGTQDGCDNLEVQAEYISKVNNEKNRGSKISAVHDTIGSK